MYSFLSRGSIPLRSTTVFVVVFLLFQPLWAQDWQQFRGGVAGKLPEISHPVEWSAEKNIAWQVPMIGSGWSSPIVVNDRIYITEAQSDQANRPKGMMAGVASMRDFRNAKPAVYRFAVSCLQLSDGKLLWSKVIGESTPPVVHPSNTYATESPATDGTRIFTFFATTGTLMAWDLDGTELWRRELGTYSSGNGFGTGSSLAVLDGRVFVQFDNEEKSFVAAFKAEDGADVWRDDRDSKTSWSTPLIWDNGERKELVTCGSGFVTSYNPVDGNVIWKLTGMESAFSASPSLDKDHLFFGNSGPTSRGPLVAVKAGSVGEIELDGEFESEKIAWSRTRSGPGMASPVVSNGCLFIPGSGGILSCYSAETGEQHYRKRISGMGTVAASLWADQDRVFILDENGTTFVIKPSPEFELLGENKIADLFWSTPAITGKTLLLRGVEKLYCIRE